MDLITTKYANEDFSKLKQLAKEGDSDAMFELGVRYETGNGTRKNRVQAMRCVVNAAAAGNAIAIQSLVGQSNLNWLDRVNFDEIGCPNPERFVESCIAIYPLDCQGANVSKEQARLDYRIAHIAHRLFHDDESCYEYAVKILEQRPYIAAELFKLSGHFESYLYCLQKGIGVKKNAKKIAEIHLMLGARREYVALATSNQNGITFSVNKGKSVKRNLRRIRYENAKKGASGCLAAPFKAYFGFFNSYLEDAQKKSEEETERAIREARTPEEWIDAMDSRYANVAGAGCLGCIVYGIALLIPIVVICFLFIFW